MFPDKGLQFLINVTTSFINLFKCNATLMFSFKKKKKLFFNEKRDSFEKLSNFSVINFVTKICNIPDTKFINIVDAPRMQIVLGINFSRAALKCARIANVRPRLCAQLITDVIVIPRRIHGIPVDLGQGLNRIRRSDWRSIHVSANKSTGMQLCE